MPAAPSAAAPTGSIDALPGVVSGSVAMSGIAADGAVAVTSVSVRYEGVGGGSSGTICTQGGLPVWQCGWDTTTVPDGAYELKLLVTNASNATIDVSRHVTVDNSEPSASFLAFTVGALIPLLVILVPVDGWRIWLTVAAVLVGLTITGFVSARLGGAPAGRAVLRNVSMGAATMAFTWAVGKAFGTVVG